MNRCEEKTCEFVCMRIQPSAFPNPLETAMIVIGVFTVIIVYVVVLLHKRKHENRERDTLTLFCVLMSLFIAFILCASLNTCLRS